MPLYEYQCKKCKHKFEKIQKFSDRPLKKCPECGGPLEKLLHAAGLNFKGAGWYVTDYAGKSVSRDSKDHSPVEKEQPLDPGKEKSGKEKSAKSEDKPKKPAAKKDKD